ncbi:DUF3857 domain-containing protein [Thermoproteota archaeon]
MKQRLIIKISLALLVLLAGCSKTEDKYAQSLEKADFYVSKGHEYLGRAVDIYSELLDETSDINARKNLKFKLGNLYLRYGNYDKAISCFDGIETQASKKMLAIAYFKNSQQADALALFESLGELDDDRYLYVYGEALEESNLYDRALNVYGRIPEGSDKYADAQKRINAIGLSEDKLSEGKIEEILSSAPGQDEYPQAGAVILLAEETFEIFEDNTALIDMHFRIKILNERGRQAFSEVKLQYDSTFEDLKLEYARTIKPDGTVIYVGDKNIRDVSLYNNFPLYSNARARIISMPEVSDGVIIEYRARSFRKQLIAKKNFSLLYPLQSGEPIKKATFKLTIPSGRDFNFKFINEEYNTFGAELKPEETIEGDKKIFNWNLIDIPEIIPEPGMPPISQIQPIILLSSFNEWQEIYTWWYGLYKDKIGVDQEIQSRISELIKDVETQEDKVRAIYNFCAQDIRYVAVEYGQAGYEPHQATDIFKNKYGDCKDQAILLIAMLREIGIEAHPVLIGTFGHLNLEEDFPTLTFNHCIAVVNLDGELIFMDPTGQTVSFRDLPGGDQDRKVFVVLEDKHQIMMTPLFESQHNTSHLKMNISINQDESIDILRSVETYGVFQQGQRHWLQFTKPKLVEEVLRSKANGMVPGATLGRYTIENAQDLDKEIILEYEFHAPEFLSRAGELRLVPQLGGIGIGAVSKEARRYPILFSIFSENKSTISFDLDDNLAIEFVPEDIHIESKWFDFENRYTKTEKGISFYERYAIKEKLISQKEYDNYKSLLEDISRKTKQKIIFKRVD